MPAKTPPKLALAAVGSGSALVDAVFEALEEAANKETTAADAISATATVLDKLLRAMHHFEAPADRFANTREVERVLSYLIREHGTVRH